ncbi:hypothetical protein BHM03_00060847 [Ensete ventricosum]|nr:hypothetical protein BHM03_00060847 [Ensete ventricosum]
MKADHDLDTIVIEGSLVVIRVRYSIPTEYGLHVPQPGQRPFSSDAPGMCISVDALEADLWFLLHPLIEECLKWWRISPSQVASNSWCYLIVFLGECRGVGIIPTRDLFMACFRFCKNRGGYYLTARVDFRVSGAPSNNKGWKSRYLFMSVTRDAKVSGGKAPSTRTAAPALEVVTSPARETPKASSKRSIDTSTEQVDDPARRSKKVKVLTRRHKSRHGEGETHSRSKGKEPAAPSEELETPVESDEGGASSVHHRPRSMKDLFKTKVHKDNAGYYTLHMSNLGHQHPDKEMKARWRGLQNSTKIWNDSSVAEEFERGLLHPQLARELYTLPSEVLLARELYTLPSKVLLAQAAKEMVLLEQELGKTKQERDEALQRLEASEKELTEVRSNLAEIQRLLKEARVKAQKMDDELLQSVKGLESARSELPKQVVDRYM